MALALLPDVVVLLRKLLLDTPEVTAIVKQRVGTASPQDTSTPWIRLSRIGGPLSSSAPMRLERALIQVDCFAPATGGRTHGDLGAMTLARTVRACLQSGAGYADDYGLIAHVEEPLGPTNQPDTSRTPPTPRVHFTVAVTTRPVD
jgi:Protein of unknown function (DUF3168)